MSVTETVYTGMSDPPLATLTFSSTTSTTFDETSTFSAVYPSLYVVDTVSVEGGTCSFPLSSVGFDNRFSQAPVPVPPALLLFAPGLLGLIGMRKRLPK